MKHPLSMTAFGRGEAPAGVRTWSVEIRSVNHRYCDIKVKIPKKYAGLEERVKKEVMAAYSRGHVDVVITLSGDTTEALKLEANLPLAREYYNSLRAIQEALALPDQPTLAMVAEFRDVITALELEEDLDAIWPPLGKALNNALENARPMREQEGAALKEELLTRLRNLKDTISAIEQAIPSLLEKKSVKLKERLDNLLKGVDIDPVRLTQEIAVMTDKSDVTEEIVRLQSHMTQFCHFLVLDEPVGRRLDFLLQEFLREINTLASKISDAPLAHQSVELKNEVEKLREQVQNLE